MRRPAEQSKNRCSLWREDDLSSGSWVIRGTQATAFRLDPPFSRDFRTTMITMMKSTDRLSIGSNGLALCAAVHLPGNVCRYLRGQNP